MRANTASEHQTGMPLLLTSLDDLETTVSRSLSSADVSRIRIALEGVTDCVHPLRWSSIGQRRLMGQHRHQWLKVIAAFTLHPQTEGAVHDGPHPRWCKRLQRVCACCNSSRIIDTPNGVRVSATVCKDRCCPRCACARAKRIADRFSELIVKMDSPRMITLTLRDDGCTLAERLTRLMQSFRKLRALPWWKSRVRGGVYAVEVTRGSKLDHWHCHLHLVVDGEYMPQGELSRAWEKVTGDSRIVDIRAVFSAAKTAHYIGEYIGKPIGWDRWRIVDVAEFAAAMHGKRLAHSFGSLHNAKSEKSDELEQPRLARTLCKVSELHQWIEFGCAHAIAAADLMQQIRGPISVVVRHELDHRSPPPIHDLTPDLSCELAGLLDLASDAARERREPTPPPRRKPDPYIPRLLDPDR